MIDPKKVVANNYTLGPDQKMLLITGPNTGGKTVSLKIIGLFVLMSVCGIPVTADEAQLPLVDGLYVDIGDDQSIVASLSTFSAHLSRGMLLTPAPALATHLRLSPSSISCILKLLKIIASGFFIASVGIKDG